MCSILSTHTNLCLSNNTTLPLSLPLYPFTFLVNIFQIENKKIRSRTRNACLSLLVLERFVKITIGEYPLNFGANFFGCFPFRPFPWGDRHYFFLRSKTEKKIAFRSNFISLLLRIDRTCAEMLANGGDSQKGTHFRNLRRSLQIPWSLERHTFFGKQYSWKRFSFAGARN